MSATLLLADDSITIQRVIELTFADEHVRVLTAGDGQAAIQKIDTERPDIVLADVGMPKIDGYGVATHIKQSAALRHIPVLLLTGAFEPIDEARARATGCEGVLVKPFEPQVLIARVRELLAGERSPKLWPKELPRVEVPAAVAAAPPAAAVVVPAPAPLAPPPAVAPPPVVEPPVIILPPVPEIPGPRVFEPVELSDLAPYPPVPQVAQPDASSDEMPMPPPKDRLNMPAPFDGEPYVRPGKGPALPPPADAFDSELDMLDAAFSKLEPTASPQVLDPATASDFAKDLEELRADQPEDDSAHAATDSSIDAARPGARSYGDWDLPSRPGSPAPADRMRADLDAPIDLTPEEVPAAKAPVWQPPPAAPVPVAAPPPPPPPPAPVAPPAPPVPVASTTVPPPIAAAPVPPTPVAPAPVAPAPIAPAPVVPPVVVPAPVAYAPPAPAIPAPPPAPPAPAPVPMTRPSLATAFSALLAAEQAHPGLARASAPPMSEAAIEEVVRRVLGRMSSDVVHKVVLDTAERIIREEIARMKEKP